MERVIDCTIITPERSLFTGKAEFVVVQAHNGQMGFLYNHAPMISELGIGEVRLEKGDQVEYLYIEGGLVELKDNRLIVLAERALHKNELNAQELKARMDILDATTSDGSAKSSLELLNEKKKVSAKLKIAIR